MVMQRADAPRPNYGNTILLWLGLVILLIGGGFIYVYGTLRQQTLDVGTTAEAATSSASSRVPRQAESSFRDLGIDPEQSGLSPEAQSAIAKAHQAALAAGQDKAAATPNDPAAVSAASEAETNKLDSPEF